MGATTRAGDTSSVRARAGAVHAAAGIGADWYNEAVIPQGGSYDLDPGD
jgi:hypothetical protein